MSRAVRDAISGAQTFGAARDTPAGAPATAVPRQRTGPGAVGRLADRAVGGVGTEVITVDQGDWDMHTDAGTLEWGDMVRNAADLASSIAAFFADLGPAAERVTLVTLSEFGRRVRENDDYGTDHGFGNVMFVAGAGCGAAATTARGRACPTRRTPTSSSPPTTAACSPRSSPDASASRSRRSSPASPRRPSA